jgi:hypothetical protein
MRNGGTLLVIDESSDTTEVLKAVFEPRGVRVDRFRTRTAPIPANGATALPAVVVIDSDSWRSPESSDDCWADAPRVIIGQARKPVPPLPGNTRPTQFLGTPFQYSELIGVIENLMRAD